MDKNKILNLIGTGTAASALLIIATLFNSGGFSNLTASASSGESIPSQAIQIDAAGLEAQNVQLQEALVIMQQREAEYQTKLEEANNLLLAPEPAASYGEEYEEYEEYEEGEEYEEEEHEEEEHEEEEHGEYEEDEDDD
jgi:hypothetical protein